MDKPTDPPFPFKDSRGNNLLFCIVCMSERRAVPNQASYIYQGNSICHEHSPSAAPKIIIGTFG